MNCRPGDLARVVACPAYMRLNDKIVRLRTAPAYYVGSTAYWNIEPILLRADRAIVDARGYHVPAGVPGIVSSIADDNLRSIRGGDISDDEVRELYAPCAGEVAHG